MFRTRYLALFLSAAATVALADEVAVGKKAPDFEATGADGKKVKLSKFLAGGKKNVALLFSRAGW